MLRTVGRNLLRSIYAGKSGNKGLKLVARPGGATGQGLTWSRGLTQAVDADGSVDADVIITNGHVIDPANQIDSVCDVAIKNDVIVAVGSNLKPKSGNNNAYHDAAGCLVTPGLVDIQVHAYEHATPYGIDIDHYCLGRGVTTVADGGASGATTFMGLRKYVADRTKTRLFVFLNIAMHGMAAGDKGHTEDLADILRSRAPHPQTAKGSQIKRRDVGGEYDSLRLVDPSVATRCIQENEDLIVGVKVRLRADACASGKNEDDAYRIALNVSAKTRKPLMTHHAESTIPTDQMTGTMGCPGSLRKGDIYSQMYQGFASGILNPVTFDLYPSVINARERGVLYDVGHGQKAFTWTVAEKCADKGFYPDVISTNLHIDNVMGPVYDLPAVMTKMLYIGMPMYDIVKATTSTAAAAIKRGDMVGSLDVGRCADVTILKEEDCGIKLEDANGQLRHLNKKLTPVATWRAGEKQEILSMETFPNTAILEALQNTNDKLVIHDGLGHDAQKMSN